MLLAVTGDGRRAVLDFEHLAVGPVEWDLAVLAADHTDFVRLGAAECRAGRAAGSLRAFLDNLGDLEGFEVRLHTRPLDLSIYHNERLMIVTTHLHGHHGEEAPTFLCQPSTSDRSLFAKYALHARRVWEQATPVDAARGG